MVAASQAGATASTLGLSTAFEGLAISLGISTTALGVLVGAIAAIAVAAVAYSAYQKHLEKIRLETEKATQAYSDASDSIDEYVARYNELHDALLKAKGSEEKTYSIKKQLLDLQTELNDKFGDEYGRLNLVTDAYKDQTEAIKAYSKEAAQTFLNENVKGIRNATDRMTEENHYNLSYTGISSTTEEGSAIKEIAEKYEEQGVKIVDEGEDGITFSVHLFADAQSAYNTINAFETDIRNKAAALGDEHMFDDIIDISSSELVRAKKIIDDNGNIYRHSLIANIVTDDNKSLIYEEALNAVNEYNDAILHSKDIFSDKNVEAAKQKLEALKDEVHEYIQDDTDGWAKYSSVMNELFEQADTKLLNFNETLQNDNGLKKLAENLKGMTNLDLLSLNPGENASFDQLKEYAEEAEISASDLIDTLIRLGYVQDKTPPTIFGTNINPSISSAISQLNTQLKPTFDALKSAYQDIFTVDNDGNEIFTLENVDLSMLDSIQSALDDLNKNEELGISIDYASFDELANVLIDSKSTAEDVKRAMNGLAGTVIQSLNPSLQSTTGETYQLTQSMLASLGVANAEEVMTSTLGYSLEELSALRKAASDAGFDLADATDREISRFIWEQTESGNCAEELYALQLKKVLLNTTTINTSKDIGYILGLANSAGIASDSLGKLAKAQEMLDTATANGDKRGIYEAKKYANQLREEIQDDILSFKAPELDYNGTDVSNTHKNTATGKDTYLEEYRQKLEELQTMLDQELINQKEFYDQSDALLNEYLKDTPAHIQKYADEISSAEKTLRGSWISSFGYEKSQLEKDLSDSALVQWQYYEQLSELAEKYYNTEGASYGKFADEYDEITREIKEGQEKLWEDIFSEVNSQLDNLQSACETVRDAIAEYSENGSLSIDTMQKLIALEPQYMAMLFDENGQLQLNAEAYERLAKTKLEELKIDLAGQALNTINSLQSEAQAVEMLTGKYAELRDTGAGAIEQQLRDAVEGAYGRGEQQGKAAEMVLQAYINQKKVLDATDLSSLSLTAEQKDSEADRFLKTFDWIGTLLEKISDKTSKLVDKADKFYSWQKKNSMINRAVKATDKEINQNQLAYQAYMKKADSVGLGLNYVRKVHNGTLSIEDVTDEKTASKIDKYSDWYDKAQGCLDTIEDLYDRQRDLIRQKLDNVLDYYSDMDGYLSSITSKIESVISLNDEMGKRTSLTELVEQFASVSDRLENATAKSAAENMTDAAVTEIPSGGSKKVAEAVKRDSKELADSIQAEIDNLDVTESGNYTRLLNDIAKTKAEIDKYEHNGWDKSKAKAYEKLQKKLQDYYDLQKALDENATSDTVGNYERIYKAWQKLQNKLDSGKTLSKSEQKRYDSYARQLDGLKAQGQSVLDRLRGELAEAEGTAPKQSEADRIKGEIDSIESDLENSVTYQNLNTNIKNAESQIADFDEAGYDNLSKKQKQTYDRMQKQLRDYYAQKDALDEGATASSIAEYNRIYLARKKLQDKLDSGKNLSEGQWKQYNDYTKQLESFKKEKARTLSERYAAQEEALNPGDKREQIEKAYEESSKDIYESYQSQIDSINGETQNSQQYKSLKAKAQKLEQKKDTKGLSKSEQANLDKYNAELEALQTGATGANIKDYMKTWEAWYKLQQKLDSDKKLSDSEARKYDTYRAQLEVWNGEKQTQINDLLSLMEDDLAQLQKTYTENMSEADSEVNDYYENLYSLAKQIAEYNISSLQTQLDYLDSYISYYKELVSLYDSFSGEKLTKILTDLDENALAKKTDVYEKYLHTLQDKYNTTLAEMNEYRQLLGALDSNDFESSMELFNKAMENYKSEGNDAMADKLQSVLNLLNERAADADNWDEYADQWANEWEEALSSAKQELIGTASEIQDINDALREIRFENITDAIEELDRAAGILSSIEGLIQDGWLFDDGQMTEYGRAKTALLVSQLEDAQAKADAYLDLYNEIQNNKDTYASDKAYQADLNDALQNYYDALGSAASFENSIMDLMKQNAEEEINSLKDIIEARKKALQSKKEYYDYDKSIRNSQKEIDSLKAQIDALENLSGATDAATKAKLAQLRAELAQKEESLQETKDEHTFNLQIDALDEFADSLTNALDNSSKSVEEILKEQKETVESAKELYQISAESIRGILQKLEAFYKGKGALSDEALLELVGENVFRYAQANTPQIAFHAETAIPDIIRERNAAPPINVHYDSLIHVEGNIDKEVADLLPEQLEQSYQYVVQQIYSDIRSVSSVKPAARSVI